MKQYIPNYTVHAKPMNRQDYIDLRGWTLPSDEDGSDTGYLFYDLNGKSNTEDHIGYASWLPTEEFERKYAQIDEFSNLVQNPKD